MNTEIKAPPVSDEEIAFLAKLLGPLVIKKADEENKRQQ